MFCKITSIFLVLLLAPLAIAGTSYSANGIYSLNIRSTANSSDQPTITLSKGKIFRLICASTSRSYGNPLPSADCGLLIGNPLSGDIFIPAIWNNNYYGSTLINNGYIGAKIAGPCTITFTNNTGVTLFHSFQITSTPSYIETQY